MGISTSKEIREKQLADVEAQVAKRIAELEQKEVTGKAQGRDPVLRALKADLKQARKRILAIDARAAHVQEAADLRAKAKAEAKDGPKKEKRSREQKAQAAQAGQKKPKTKAKKGK